MARLDNSVKLIRRDDATQAQEGPTFSSYGSTSHSRSEGRGLDPANIIPSLDNTEESPLLVNDDERDNGIDDDEFGFAHLPWHRRPSVFWILIPFVLFTITFGGTMVPKLNLILDMICREYIAEQSTLPGANSTALWPLGEAAGDERCGMPDVQRRVADFSLYGNIIGGVSAAFVNPKLGQISDWLGRRKVIMFAFSGTVIAELIAFVAAWKVASFPPYLFLVSYLIDGLFGSFILAMAIAHAYATDCTPPKQRNVVFGYFHASLFIGIAIGPIFAGLLIKATESLASIFLVAAVSISVSVLFIAFAVPESLTPQRQEAARKKAEREREMARNSTTNARYNPLAPLKVLYPLGPGSSSTLRRNLVTLAAIDSIVLGIAIGVGSVVIYYCQSHFHWGTFESSIYLSVVGFTRVIALLGVLPLATRLFRSKATTSTDSENSGADPFDLNVIRIAILFDVAAYAGFIFARTGAAFTLFGALASFGALSSPALQSALTRHVHRHKTGQILGATGLLHALSRVAGPTIFNFIYRSTVGIFDQAVFVTLSGTFAFVFLISWIVKPGVVLEDKIPPPVTDVDADADGDENSQDRAEQRERRTLVS